MAFEVEITEAALNEAEDYVRFIRDRRLDPLAAERWWNGLVSAILSLEDMPGRCPLIPEHAHFTEEMRQLIYFSHRIIFSISPGKVTVLRIYHGSRQRLQ